MGSKTTFKLTFDGPDSQIPHAIRIRYKNTWSSNYSVTSDGSQTAYQLNKVVSTILTSLTGVQWAAIEPFGNPTYQHVANNYQVFDVNDFQINSGYLYSSDLKLDATSDQIKSALVSLGYLGVTMVTNWPVSVGPIRFNYVGPIYKSNLALDVSGLGSPLATAVLLNDDLAAYRFIDAVPYYPNAEFTETDRNDTVVPNRYYDGTNPFTEPTIVPKYVDSNKVWVNSFNEFYLDGILKFDQNEVLLDSKVVDGSIIAIDRFNDIYVAHRQNPRTNFSQVDKVEVYDRNLVYKGSLPSSNNTLAIVVDRHHNIYAITAVGITKYDQSFNLIAQSGQLQTNGIVAAVVTEDDKIVIGITRTAFGNNWSVE